MCGQQSQHAVISNFEAGGYREYKIRGVPGFVILVDKTIALQSYGAENWNNKVFPLLKELVAKKKAERDTAPVVSEVIVK